MNNMRGSTGGFMGGGFRGTGSNNNNPIGMAFGGGGNIQEKKPGKSPDELVKELLTSSWLKFGVTPMGSVYKGNQIPKGMNSMALPNNDGTGYVFPGIPYSRDELYLEAAKQSNPIAYVGEAIQKVEDCRVQWLTAYHNQTNQFFNPSQLISGLTVYQESLNVHSNASRWKTDDKLFENQPNIEIVTQSTTTPLGSSALSNNQQGHISPAAAATGTNTNASNTQETAAAAVIDNTTYIQLGRDQTLTRFVQANMENYTVPDFSLQGIPLEPPTEGLR